MRTQRKYFHIGKWKSSLAKVGAFFVCVLSKSWTFIDLNSKNDCCGKWVILESFPRIVSVQRERERSQACTRRGLENFKVWEKETENAVFLRRLFFWKKFLNCWLLVSRLGLTQSIIFYFQDQSEDCLYLNIYTPTNSAFAKGKSSPFLRKKMHFWCCRITEVEYV